MQDADYKALYLSLFNDVTDIIEELEGFQAIIQKLKSAQLRSEELFIETADEPLGPLHLVNFKPRAQK